MLWRAGRLFAGVVVLTLVGIPSAVAAPGDVLWVGQYDGGLTQAINRGEDVVTSPDGTRVFVTGQSGPTIRFDYATVAYDASTGAELWSQRFHGTSQSERYDDPTHIAVSPDGSRVFVTGSVENATTGLDAGTVAYDAATGTQLWAATYDSGGGLYEYGNDLVVSPDGSRVYVTGSTDISTQEHAVLTIAYDAATGSTVWLKKRRAGKGYAGALAIGISPNGAKIFVTGGTDSAQPTGDYLTIAYRAATGVELWAARYDGPAHRGDYAEDLAVNGDGSRIYVTGSSGTDAICHGCSPMQYATIAYDALTGSQVWIARFGSRNYQNFQPYLGLSPDGTRLFVTGRNSHHGEVFGTVGYDAATGARLWVQRYDAYGFGNRPTGIVVAPDGANVYVTGWSYDPNGYGICSTLSYAAATGQQVWLSRAGLNCRTFGIAVGSDGSRVFVAGEAPGPHGYAITTIAYSTH